MSNQCIFPARDAISRTASDGSHETPNKQLHDGQQNMVTAYCPVEREPSNRNDMDSIGLLHFGQIGIGDFVSGEISGIWESFQIKFS